MDGGSFGIDCILKCCAGGFCSSSAGSRSLPPLQLRSMLFLDEEHKSFYKKGMNKITTSIQTYGKVKHLLLEDRLTPDDEFRWLNLHREPVKHEKNR